MFLMRTGGNTITKCTQIKVRHTRGWWQRTTYNRVTTVWTSQNVLMIPNSTDLLLDRTGMLLCKLLNTLFCRRFYFLEVCSISAPQDKWGVCLNNFLAKVQLWCVDIVRVPSKIWIRQNCDLIIIVWRFELAPSPLSFYLVLKLISCILHLSQTHSLLANTNAVKLSTYNARHRGHLYVFLRGHLWQWTLPSGIPSTVFDLVPQCEAPTLTLIISSLRKLGCNLDIFVIGFPAEDLQSKSCRRISILYST